MKITENKDGLGQIVVLLPEVVYELKRRRDQLNGCAVVQMQMIGVHDFVLTKADRTAHLEHRSIFGAQIVNEADWATMN